jgi:hypothetical protein
MGLGDLVEQALTRAGITQERVEAWLGRPCHCEERKARLNALSSWAWRVLKGRDRDPRGTADDIMGASPE